MSQNSFLNFQTRVLRTTVKDAKMSMKTDLFKQISDFKQQSTLLSSKYVPYHLKLTLLDCLKNKTYTKDEILLLCYCIHNWATEQSFYNSLIRNGIDLITARLDDTKRKLFTIKGIFKSLKNELKELKDEDYEFYFERFHDGYRDVNESMTVIQKRIFKLNNPKMSLLKRTLYNASFHFVTSTLNTILDDALELGEKKCCDKTNKETESLLEELTQIHLGGKTNETLLKENGNEDLYELVIKQHNKNNTHVTGNRKKDSIPNKIKKVVGNEHRTESDNIDDNNNNSNGTDTVYEKKTYK